MKKYCTRCEMEKDGEDFYRRRKNRDFSSYCKKCTSDQTLERQQHAKRMCAEYKGGKCIKCGYDKYIGALDFHHRDPNEKDFNISGIKRTTINDKIRKELDKCDLLCCRCHREEHALWRYGELYELSGDYLVLKKDKIVKNCIDCKLEINCQAERCTNCNGKNRRKVVWPSRDELCKMLQEMSYCAIGRKYGVSDNAVRKWKKSYGI